MFSCKDITEHASDYVDGRMSWRDRVKYRLHLFICHNCRNYVAQFRATIAALITRRRAPDPATVNDTVAKLRREHKSLK